MGVEEFDESVLLRFAGFVQHVGEQFLVLGEFLWGEVGKCVLVGLWFPITQRNTLLLMGKIKNLRSRPLQRTLILVTILQRM